MKRHLRWLLAALFTIIAGAVIVYMARSRPPVVEPPQPTRPNDVPSSEPVRIQTPDTNLLFADVTPGSGIDFTYFGGPTPHAHMTEQNGGGVALLDFDGDGQLDVFFVNGSSFEDSGEPSNRSNSIYRNKSEFRFTDVTMPSGLSAHGFGMGCASGDYDNDGFPDLFVTYFGRDRMWHNNGDGTFREVTHSAGVASELWGTSATFADMNDDGLPDLYVVNYVDWSPSALPCHPPEHPEINSICSPVDRSGQPDLLYENLGNGHFREVLQQTGTPVAQEGKGLALAVADFDDDGLPDIYVANDTSRNFLHHNLGDMKFEEIGVSSGVAISSDGRIGSGMGVAVADFDRNGYLDIAVTNFRNQINDLFSNFGQSRFAAVNSQSGLDSVSRLPLGFGIVAADFNLDGHTDIFVANGHIWNWEVLGPEYEYHMRPQLISNVQGRRFRDVSESSGDYFQRRWLGRAAAMGDLDGDGDSDLVVTHADTSPVMLENRTQALGVTIEFIGRRSARDARGKTVTAIGHDTKISTTIPAGGSFQSSHATQVVVPRNVKSVSIRWSGEMPFEFSLENAFRTGPSKFVVVQPNAVATQVE